MMSGRRHDDGPDGGLTVGDRIGRVESKLDQLYWLVIVTLAATVTDLLTRSGMIR